MGAQGKLRASRFETVETPGIPSDVRSSLGVPVSDDFQIHPEANYTLAEADRWWKRGQREIFEDVLAGKLPRMQAGPPGRPLTPKNVLFKGADLIDRRNALRVLATKEAA